MHVVGIGLVQLQMCPKACLCCRRRCWADAGSSAGPQMATRSPVKSLPHCLSLANTGAWEGRKEVELSGGGRREGSPLGKLGQGGGQSQDLAVRLDRNPHPQAAWPQSRPLGFTPAISLVQIQADSAA